MESVTRGQRIYLGAVAALALWVGVWCFFVPGMADIAIPWRVQPLCAAFLGAVYFSGAVYTGTSIRAQRWSHVRVLMPNIALWTGGLTVVSLFHFSRFDFSRGQVWIWFGAYLLYPAIAMWLMWTHRHLSHAPGPHEPRLPRWARVYLVLQGAGLITLALALLAATRPMQSVWPWQTGRLMLHLYSMPLLSYGIGSLHMARQRTWPEIRHGLLAIGVFAGLGLIGSLWHQRLLDGPALAVAGWLAWLAVSAAVLGGMAWLGFRPAAPALLPAGWRQPLVAPRPR
jgi:hypothetical protein